MQKFRKKPVVVEAVQYTGSVSSTIFIYGLVNKIDIETEDILLVSKGDWVIKGIKGEF